MSPPQDHITSPLEEEDISRAAVLHDGPASGTRDPNADPKRKQKQRAQDPFEDEPSASESDEAEADVKTYPPRKSEEEESRRVSENLRRWEQTERQRRKAARDSSSSAATSSLVGDVTRRASLLWSGSRSKHGSTGSGAHQVLRNVDDTVPLDDIDTVLPVSPAPAPDNPFLTPNASTTSLTAPHHSALMAEASEPATTSNEETRQRLLSPADAGNIADQPPSSGARPHPPPQPLGLPEPRTPPPRESLTNTDRPPEPISPPTISQKDEEEERSRSRWWTDWLCGCRESGDQQAGRTNPFE